MTPAALYERAPESADRDLTILVGCYYNHIPEASIDYYGQIYGVQQERVEIRYYKRFNFDGRRFWALASVWFDDAPVMIIQNAGREGDDHAARFITDPEQYTSMVHFIASLRQVKLDEVKDVVKATDDLPLESFYGNSLDGHFEGY